MTATVRKIAPPHESPRRWELSSRRIRGGTRPACLPHRLRLNLVDPRAVFAGDVDAPVGLDHVGPLRRAEGLQHVENAVLRAAAEGPQRLGREEPHATLV